MLLYALSLAAFACTSFWLPSFASGCLSSSASGLLVEVLCLVALCG